MRNPTDIKLCMSHTNCLFTRPHTQKTCRIQSVSVYGHYGQRAARIGPESICRIRLPVSVFPKKAWIILCKTDPDPIWMAWSGFSQTYLFQKQAGLQESSGPVFGRKQPACYQFPTFRLGSILLQTSQIILCQTSPDPIEFWLIVPGFTQTDPVRKQAGVQESSGPLLANASKPIRTGCESDPACLLGQLDDWQNPAHKLWLDCL